MGLGPLSHLGSPVGAEPILDDVDPLIRRILRALVLHEPKPDPTPLVLLLFHAQGLVEHIQTGVLVSSPVLFLVVAGIRPGSPFRNPPLPP